MRDQLNAAERAGRRGRRPHGDDRDPADAAPRPHDARVASAATRATRCSTSRCCSPAARTCRSTSAAGRSASRRTPTRSPPRRPARSAQFHLQVSPDEFAEYWNAAQASPPCRSALGANSPYFLGRELWRETRIALFEQATDTRPEELQGAGRAPAGVVRRALDHRVFDLFEENVTLLPGAAAGDRRRGPGRPCSTPGGTPALHELRLHNGTIYRWNRPVYDVVHGTPAPARGEPRAAGRPDGRRHPRQRRASTSARCARSPSRSGRCGRRCRSAPPRRTSTPPRSTASTRASTGRASGEVPVHRAGAAPAAAAGARGPARVGRRRRRSASGCSASSRAAA